MSAEILKLDRDQIKFLLKNHECFTDKEVKIAAKRLAQGDFKPKTARDASFDIGEQQRAFRSRELSLSDYQNTVGIQNITGRMW